MTDDQTKIRLNKYISDTGICSRREADKLIEQGKVKINGKIPELGTKVGPTDQVTINGKPIGSKKPNIYIALNKPVGITCTTELHVDGRNAFFQLDDWISRRKA